MLFVLANEMLHCRCSTVRLDDCWPKHRHSARECLVWKRGAAAEVAWGVSIILSAVVLSAETFVRGKISGLSTTCVPIFGVSR